MTSAINDGANIKLTGDIKLSKHLNINGITLTIDLNGHKLFRELSSFSSYGHVFWVEGHSNLTLESSIDGGSIEGGKSDDFGGAIFISEGSTVTAKNVTFKNNSASQFGGAILNNGTFTVTDCTITDNTAGYQGGGATAR